MSVPVLGLIENMATYACPHCGEASHPFGTRRRRSGGRRTGHAVPRAGCRCRSRSAKRPTPANRPPRRMDPKPTRSPTIAAKLLAAVGALSRLMPLTRDEDIAELLTNARTIAMIGASDRPDRASLRRHEVPPGPRLPRASRSTRRSPASTSMASSSGASSPQIGVPIDIVDIFRRPEAAGEAVDAGDLRRRQGGVDAAGRRSTKKQPRAPKPPGLKVVMDRCPKIEIARLRLPPRGRRRLSRRRPSFPA